MVKVMTLQPSSSFRGQGSLGRQAQVAGVDDGLHGSAIQRTIGIHGHLTGGIGDLLDSDKKSSYFSYLLAYFSRLPWRCHLLHLRGALVDGGDAGVG